MNKFNTLTFNDFSSFQDEDYPLGDFKSIKDKELYDSLVKEDYIQRKCSNRKKRFSDLKGYLNQLAPEILAEQNKNLSHLYVIDIGPGPGELLEIARKHGYNHLGFDASIDDCEMGDNYIQYSSLMARTQNLNIEYCDFYQVMRKLPLGDNSCALINSRGSIEQVYRSHLQGVPHKIHKDAKQLEWIIDDSLKTAFLDMFSEFSRVLVVGGTVLIHGNGASNVEKYNDLIIETVSKIEGIVLEASDGERLHKMRRIK
jgi:hypothetical protein